VNIVIFSLWVQQVSEKGSQADVIKCYLILKYFCHPNCPKHHSILSSLPDHSRTSMASLRTSQVSVIREHVQKPGRFNIAYATV